MINSKVGISLGWRCQSAMYGVKHKIRQTKRLGYNTCPFDMMISNYQGIIDCFVDDFAYLYDPLYLKLRTVPIDSAWKGETFIYNTKYKFIFNHESPGHANLYLSEKWSEGINHYCLNDFKNFVTRYENRVNNLKNYLKSNNHIIFIIERYNHELKDISELITVIKTKYPNLSFEFVLLNDNDNVILYESLTVLMGVDENSAEVKRLNYP